jgi:Holliday junction resolvase
MQSAAKRGSAFEMEIAGLLRAGGFDITMNAGAARPRQTDIHAQREGITLLVEAKNRRRKVDVADVDDLRVRLQRTTADVVGVVFTASYLLNPGLLRLRGIFGSELSVRR